LNKLYLEKHSNTLLAEPAALKTKPEESTPSTVITPSLIGFANTLIVIPAFNEEKNIGRVLEGIRNCAPEIPVLVINDGSRDATAQICREQGAKVISLPFNSGYGVALQTGFIFALKNGYTTVLQMDADGQHDPRYIVDMLQEIQNENLDVVIGSRFLEDHSYKTTFLKRLGMIIFGNLASLFCRQRVSDPTSGYQVLKGKAIQFVASEYYPPDYPDADFIIMLHQCGFKTREIPVTMHPSPDNKSMHNGHKSIYYVFKMFLSIIVTLLRQKPKENS
jgi:glycosyltransferase involved in cell wall biosynthesis